MVHKDKHTGAFPQNKGKEKEKKTSPPSIAIFSATREKAALANKNCFSLCQQDK